MALQGCGDFANDQVIHLLGGLWVVSVEGKEVLLVTVSMPCHALFTPRGSEKMNAWMVMVIWSQLFYFFPGTRLHL